MTEIKDFPYELKKPLVPSLYLLRKCNIIFFDKNGLQKKWRFFFLVFFIFIHYISMSVYVCHFLTTNVTILEMSYMVSIHLVITQGFFKAAVTLPKRADIGKLIIQLSKMWRTDDLTDDQIEKKNQILKRFNFGFAICFWCNLIGAWQNIMAPLFVTLFRKLILNQDTELLLPFACIYPFDPVKNWQYYIAVYMFQVYTSSRIAYHYIGTELLMITLCAYLSTEFALLREDLKNILPRKRKFITGQSSADNTRDPFDSIKNFIRNHQHLIQLSNTFNNIYCKMVFVNLLFTTVIMCFFAFGLTVAHSTVDIANNLVALFALMLPIYILCYYAELLKEESSGIADSAYESLWYKGDRQYQLIILFIITRAQHPCYLTSLNYAPVTLNTFTKVVSTTWSYFSLARTMFTEN